MINRPASRTTRDVDWPDGLRPDGSDRELVVDNRRDHAFTGTRLAPLLRSPDIATVIVCGVATTGCGASTNRDDPCSTTMWSSG